MSIYLVTVHTGHVNTCSVRDLLWLKENCAPAQFFPSGCRVGYTVCGRTFRFAFAPAVLRPFVRTLPHVVRSATLIVHHGFSSFRLAPSGH